ncbi:hypothetical protein CYMTET_9408 [Cymbomonas tetramitiformis]|uniref:EGF-like domain-containing protein n=1 Tax=Cymbomonas tetramitiformis TaxID=36881 RepID=A0AAE0LF57_9CHLO|nr:hypothetical protein CYMTET_9408 [Cymbomonas tetramitiformis]
MTDYALYGAVVYAGALDTHVQGDSLAMYTGNVPTPMAVRFEATSLLLQFIVGEPTAGTQGFRLHYLTDGECYNACGHGFGTCKEGLCECPSGYAGADCSIPVDLLIPSEKPLTGRVEAGGIRYFRVEVPEGPPGMKMLVELTFPEGIRGARPLLMLGNGTAQLAHGHRQHSDVTDQKVNTTPGVFYSRFLRPDDGLCQSHVGCRWCAGCASEDAFRGAPEQFPRVRLGANHTAQYRVGSGTPLPETYHINKLHPHTELQDVWLPALPTLQYNAMKDYEGWDLHKPYHYLFVSDGTTPDPHANYTYSESSSTLPHAQPLPVSRLTPGTWYIGVANTPEITLPYSLNLNDAGSDWSTADWWGYEDPGFFGASDPLAFQLAVTLSPDLDQLCPQKCSNGAQGTCKGGKCICRDLSRAWNRRSSSRRHRSGNIGGRWVFRNGRASWVPRTPSSEVAYVGEQCSLPADVLQDGIIVSAPKLRAGEWKYFYLLMPREKCSGSLHVDLEFIRSPDAVPYLFASRAESALPKESFECRMATSNSSQAFLSLSTYDEMHCLITGFEADVQHTAVQRESYGQSQVDEGGESFISMHVPEETHIVPGSMYPSACTAGYVVAVYNHPGHSASDLHYRIQASFVTSDTRDGSSCPFDCSHAGWCDADATKRAGPAPGTSQCICNDKSRGGVFCQDTARELKPNITTYSKVEYGGRSISYFEVEEDEADVLIEMQNSNPETSVPVLVVKKGGFPSLTPFYYASQVEALKVVLNSSINGTSVGPLLSPRNSEVSLNIPPKAQVCLLFGSTRKREGVTVARNNM